MLKLLSVLSILFWVACTPKPVYIERLVGLPHAMDSSHYVIAIDNFETWNEDSIGACMCSLYMSSDTFWSSVEMYHYNEYVNTAYLKDNHWAYWRYASPEASIGDVTLLYNAKGKTKLWLLKEDKMLVRYYLPKGKNDDTRHWVLLPCASAIKEKYKSGGFKTFYNKYGDWEITIE